MNRRPSGSLSLSKAITGFLQYKAAEGLSPNTLHSYQRDLKLWLEYAGDIPLHQITTSLLQEYFVWWLLHPAQPGRRLESAIHALPGLLGHIRRSCKIIGSQSMVKSLGQIIVLFIPRAGTEVTLGHVLPG